MFVGYVCLTNIGRHAFLNSDTGNSENKNIKKHYKEKNNEFNPIK